MRRLAQCLLCAPCVCSTAFPVGSTLAVMDVDDAMVSVDWAKQKLPGVLPNDSKDVLEWLNNIPWPKRAQIDSWLQGQARLQESVKQAPPPPAAGPLAGENALPGENHSQLCCSSSSKY